MLRLMRFGVYFETKMAIFIKKIIIVYLHSYARGSGVYSLYATRKKIENVMQFGSFWCIF